ncbi:MAG: DUF4258 domain-containing protein [Pseudohongiellaceae bacterium]
MNSFQDKVSKLIAQAKVRVSGYGYDELADDGLSARDIVSGFSTGELVEEYPDFAKGPCGLFLQEDIEGNPVHVVWGIPKGYDEPVVLVTAYRPDPSKWNHEFRKRLK